MPEIIIYSTPICPYCQRAKQLLARKGQTAYTEINIAADETAFETMLKKSGGRRTVPQIFINGRHIGGFDDLNALDQKGELDGLLAQ